MLKGKALMIQPDVEDKQEDILFNLIDFSQEQIQDEEEFAAVLWVLIEEETKAEMIENEIGGKNLVPDEGIENQVYLWYGFDVNNTFSKFYFIQGNI